MQRACKFFLCLDMVWASESAIFLNEPGHNVFAFFLAILLKYVCLFQQFNLKFFFVKCLRVLALIDDTTLGVKLTYGRLHQLSTMQGLFCHVVAACSSIRNTRLFFLSNLVHRCHRLQNTSSENSLQRGHTKVRSHIVKFPHVIPILRFTYYIYKPVYANESSKYASQLANSVRPKKKHSAEN